MAKMIFSNSSSAFIFDGSTYYLTDLTFNQGSDKIDVTDTGTSGDGKEYIYGRKERTFNAQAWKDSATALPTLATSKACTLKFEGNMYVGSASLESVEVAGSIDNGVKLTVNGTFNGAVSSSL